MGKRNNQDDDIIILGENSKRYIPTWLYEKMLKQYERWMWVDAPRQIFKERKDLRLNKNKKRR